MTAMRIAGFAGIVPRSHRRLLAGNQAQIAMNCRLTNGQIQPLREPVAVHAPGVTNLSTIFRTEHGGEEAWLTWDKHVNVVRGPVAGDTKGRVYWSNDYEPRMSVFANLTSGSGPYPGGSGSIQYVLGVFAPTAAPTVGHSGGAAANITPAFAYTFVTPLGEESQPSPATTHSGPSDATSWNISGMEVAPVNSFAVTGATWADGVAVYTVASARGLRAGEEINISSVLPAEFMVVGEILEVTATTVAVALADDPGTYVSGGLMSRVALHNTTGMFKRIYAVVTATSGAPEYRLWADNVPAADTTYSAAYDVTALALAPILRAETWEMPPANLRFLVSMPNGMMAGVSGKEICFSEPFRPHAWPSDYRQTIKHTPVALGSFDTTLVIATDGVPYTISGVNPSTMGGGAQAIEEAWPCVSARGMVSTSFGVMYPAPQGLVLIGIGGAQIVTRDFYTQEEWRNVYPETFVASIRDGRYYAGYRVDEFSSYTLIIDKSEFASVTLANYPVTASWTDPTTGVLYVVINNIICEWDSTEGSVSMFDWMSKEFLSPPPVNFAAARIEADFAISDEEVATQQAAYDAVVEENLASLAAGTTRAAYGMLPVGKIPIGGTMMAKPPSTVIESLLFELYVDNALKFSKQIRSSKAVRLPAGYKTDTVAIRLAGNVRVTGVAIATSMTDLRNV